MRRISSQTSFRNRPPHVEYSLTSFGKLRMPIIKTLVNWKREKRGSIAKALEK